MGVNLRTYVNRVNAYGLHSGGYGRVALQQRGYSAYAIGTRKRVVCRAYRWLYRHPEKIGRGVVNFSRVCSSRSVATTTNTRT